MIVKIEGKYADENIFLNPELIESIDQTTGTQGGEVYHVTIVTMKSGRVHELRGMDIDKVAKQINEQIAKGENYARSSCDHSC